MGGLSRGGRLMAVGVAGVLSILTGGCGHVPDPGRPFPPTSHRAPVAISPTGARVAAPAQGRPPARTAEPSPAYPCGTSRLRPNVDEVLLIWEENHGYSSIIGDPSAPELNGLAAKCGLATGYDALTHPSLPNYLEMTSGQSYASSPWASDCDAIGSCVTSAPSVFSELGASGRQWRAYAEDMGGDCGRVSFGDYAARHNPAVYYVNVRRQCQEWDVPLGTPTAGALHTALRNGPSVPLTTVTPDVMDDMHTGTVTEADSWLARWVPQVISSPAYRAGRLAVIIAWDEGEGSGNVPSHAPLIVMSATTPAGTRSAVAFDDYSVLRAICQLTGVPVLGRAINAASLVGPFHL